MRRAICITVLVVLTGMLAGCGGGGGGSQLPLSSTVRAWQAGDQWTYSLTGNVTDGTDTLPVTGTWTETVTDETVITPKGSTARAYLTTMSVTIEGETFIETGKYYMTQDANGAIFTHGGQNSDGVWWVTTPSIGYYTEVASPLAQGTSWAATVEATDGQSYTTTSVVVGTETISVPAGAFSTYKATEAGMVGSYPATCTTWYAPQVGNFVKIQMTMTMPEEGLTFNLVVSLTTKNRSIPNSAVGKAFSSLSSLFDNAQNPSTHK